MDLARSSLPLQTARSPSPRRWLDHRSLGTVAAAVALVALLATVFALLPAPATTASGTKPTTAPSAPVHSDAALAAAALAGEFNVFQPIADVPQAEEAAPAQ